jgi:hypothetical protein
MRFFVSPISLVFTYLFGKIISMSFTLSITSLFSIILYLSIFKFELQATKHAIRDTCPRPNVKVVPVKIVSSRWTYFSYDNVVTLLVLVLFINCLILIFYYASRRGGRNGYQAINPTNPINASK